MSVTAGTWAGYMAARNRRTADRLEDLRDFAQTGETATGAATRLGIARESLRMWCSRNEQLAVWDQLARRERSRDNQYTRRPEAS